MKRKYYRRCGICGDRDEQSNMYRDDGSPNGWLCLSCFEGKHIDHWVEEW